MKKPSLQQRFEKSGADREPKGVKEGSKEDRALDKKQFAAFKKGNKKR